MTNRVRVSNITVPSVILSAQAEVQEVAAQSEAAVIRADVSDGNSLHFYPHIYAAA